MESKQPCAAGNKCLLGKGEPFPASATHRCPGVGKAQIIATDIEEEVCVQEDDLGDGDEPCIKKIPRPFFMGYDDDDDLKVRFRGKEKNQSLFNPPHGAFVIPKPTIRIGLDGAILRNWRKHLRYSKRSQKEGRIL